MSNSSDSGVDLWYENIAVYSSDYEPATFSAGSSVEANHDLLAGVRENDFDVEDTAYSERCVEPARMLLG